MSVPGERRAPSLDGKASDDEDEQPTVGHHVRRLAIVALSGRRRRHSSLSRHHLSEHRHIIVMTPSRQLRVPLSNCCTDRNPVRVDASSCIRVMPPALCKTYSG